MYRFLILFTIFLNCLGNPAPSLPKSSIVGGAVAKSIPYQVSVESRSQSCGGSIVSTRAVLTAAHCMISHPKSYWLRVGSNTWNSGQVVSIHDAIIHPKYNESTLDYDIAVLYLDSTLVFKANVQSIPMANPNDSLTPGTMAVISGWGYESEDASDGTPQLMFAKVPIIDKEICKYKIFAWTERSICAGYRTGGVDACRGDSGGPLVANRKLFGIISSGYGCAHGYGNYMSIPVLRLWIDEAIKTLEKRNIGFWDKLTNSASYYLGTQVLTESLINWIP